MSVKRIAPVLISAPTNRIVALPRPGPRPGARRVTATIGAVSTLLALTADLPEVSYAPGDVVILQIPSAETPG